ncbi:hypothetical protein VPH35_071225 [Triticum aestivum]|nr:protein enabled-like isoform X1 [Triticum aestivum]
MWEHFPPRASAGSRGPAPHHHHHRHRHDQQHVAPPDCQQQQHAAPHGDPDPLASVWIRRLHLAPSPPPPRASHPPPPSTPLHGHDAVSARSAGFGPFRWSPRPPVGAWDATPAPAPCGGGGAPPMMSPFFRSPPQPLPALAGAGEFAPVRPTIGFPGMPSPTVLGVNPHASWLPTAAAGPAYPNHDVGMIPVRTSHDLHVRQHSMIPQNFARRAPSSSSENDEPFSYWNMGRFQRSTTTSSISQVAVEPGNFVKKRNADSNSLLPLKFRKLSGAG